MYMLMLKSVFCYMRKNTMLSAMMKKLSLMKYGRIMFIFIINGEKEEAWQDKRLSERPSFASFARVGNDQLL